MTSRFGMVGKLEAAPENRETLVEILTQAAAQMEALDGCHAYIVSRDADNPGAVWVMELWESKEAHDQSLALPETRALIGQALPILTAKPDGATLIPVAGKGLP